MSENPPTDSRSYLVLGATSRIARAISQTLAAPGTDFVLVARDGEELERCAADLRIRSGCRVVTQRFDALDFASHSKWVEEWCQLAGGAPDGVVLAFGHLPDPEQARTDAAEASRTIAINFTSAASLLTLLAARMADRGDGWIVGISSVAGDRGRQSNYVYGSAKAGLTTYLDGLRSRLQPLDVHVLTVKPGFVDTPMLRSQMAGPSRMIATPERVARDIERALRRRRNTLYTPWYWRIIMLVIRAIPEPLFKRMKL